MSSPLYHHELIATDDPNITQEATFLDGVDEDESFSLRYELQPRQSSGERRWAVALFSGCTILLFADQNLMSPNLTAIAEDFGFSEEERDKKLGGQIALAFFVLGAPASFLVGCLADSYNRSRLFAWTVGIGEGACCLTYWTSTYRQLYVCRAITGFSLGGALPLIYSVLGDLFAADERHSVNAIVGMGTGLGISIGQGVAGFLGPTFGWRLPFLVVSIPALMCAAAVLFTVQDPERGGMEQAVREHRRHNTDENGLASASASASTEMAPLGNNLEKCCISKQSSVPMEEEFLGAVDGNDEFDAQVHWNAFWSLLSTPTVVLTLLQGAPGCVPWGIVNTYLNDFLSENRGMTVESATLTVLIFGVGNFLGLLLGGAGGSFLYRRDKRYPALFAGSMAILACFPFWILLNHVNASSSFATVGIVSILAGLTSGATGPIVKATLQNVTLPQSRGQAFALFNTFDDFGRGLGPVFVSVLITRLGGRTPAFNIGVLGWMVCGLFNLMAFFTVERDERVCQTTIAAGLSRNQVDTNSDESGFSVDFVVERDDPLATTKRRPIPVV